MRSMKSTFLALIALAGLSASAMAQTGQTRNVSGYHGVASGGSFNVHVKIDGTESLRIDASPEDLREIETRVEDGILQINPVREERHNYYHFGHVDVYVSAKSLSSLSIGGSGDMDVDGVVKGENMHLSVAGSGNIKTAVQGGGLDTHIAGSGNITLKGTAGSTKVSISGSGDLKAEDFKTDDANINIAGSGTCRLGVDKSISAFVAGSGSVYYTGNATVANFSSAGSGRIKKM